jgi:hypothetical protein
MLMDRIKLSDWAKGILDFFFSSGVCYYKDCGKEIILETINPYPFSKSSIAFSIVSNSGL